MGRNSLGVSLSLFCKRLKINSLKIKVVSVLVAVVAVIAIILMNNTLVYGDTYILDPQGNKIVDRGFQAIVYDKSCASKRAQYMISNSWPRWSPFYREYWGIINIETGEVGEPKFSDRLLYKRDFMTREPGLIYDYDLAWDYNGHFVDKDGNIEVDCSFFNEGERFGDNPRKYAIYMYQNRVYENYSLSNFVEMVQTGRTFDNCYAYDCKADVGEFAENGLAVYVDVPQFSSSKKKYGYINRQGEVVIPAEYSYASRFDENNLAVVSETSLFGLMNMDREYVIEPKYESISYLYDEGVYEVIDYRATLYFDAQGNLIDEIPEKRSRDTDRSGEPEMVHPGDVRIIEINEG